VWLIYRSEFLAMDAAFTRGGMKLTHQLLRETLKPDLAQREAAELSRSSS
jgi:hypothetical protein